MNRGLNFIKNLLLIINLIGIMFLFKFDQSYNESIDTIQFVIYIFLFVVLLFLTIRDFIKKIKNSNQYCLLLCLVETISLFILYRTYFSFNFVKEINIFPLFYFKQNLIYLIILYLCLIIYHKIECKKIDYHSKFSRSSIIYLLINILLIVPSLNCISYSLDKLLVFILIEIVMVVLEVKSLIKNNHKKYDFPIYLSFISNTVAFIFIIIAFII